MVLLRNKKNNFHGSLCPDRDELHVCSWSIFTSFESLLSTAKIQEGKEDPSVTHLSFTGIFTNHTLKLHTETQGFGTII